MGHPDQIFDNPTLRDMLGPTRTDSWTRRLRELRELRYGGYTIQSHRERPDLRPGQYVFPAQPYRKAVHAPRISNRVRAEVLFRDSYVCQICGIARGERYEDGRMVTVQVAHNVADSHGGPPTEGNCFTACARCNEGESNVGPDRPTVSKTKAQVLKLPRNQAREIYEFLRSIFER